MCGGREPLDLHVANPTAIAQESRAEVNGWGIGSFAGGRYSSHRLWAQGGFRIWLHDLVNAQHMAEVTGVKPSRSRFNA